MKNLLTVKKFAIGMSILLNTTIDLCQATTTEDGLRNIVARYDQLSNMQVDGKINFTLNINERSNYFYLLAGESADAKRVVIPEMDYCSGLVQRGGNFQSPWADKINAIDHLLQLPSYQNPGEKFAELKLKKIQDRVVAVRMLELEGFDESDIQRFGILAVPKEWFDLTMTKNHTKVSLEQNAYQRILAFEVVDLLSGADKSENVLDLLKIPGVNDLLRSTGVIQAKMDQQFLAAYRKRRREMMTAAKSSINQNDINKVTSIIGQMLQAGAAAR